MEYEPDVELRDSEQVPLLEEGASRPLSAARCCPTRPDAWMNAEATKMGYEVSFTRHFYKPKPLRTLAEIARRHPRHQKEAEGLLDGLLVGAGGGV